MKQLIEPITIAALLAGFYVAWNLGASDSANCVGTAIGGRILSYRRAVAIMILFVLLGATLEGWKNMRTVGEGIVTGPLGNPLSDFPLIIISTMLAAGIWITIATTLGLPVSSSQTMVGAVIGAGLLLSYAQPGGATANIQFGILGAIAISWVLNPIFAALLAFTISKTFSSLLRRIKNIVLLNQVLLALFIVASAATAYSLGANDVGTSTGAIYAFFGGGGTDYRLMVLIGLFGGIGLAVGVLTYGRKVVQTVSTGITRLDAMSAFAAQLGAAITVWSFVQLRIPVSITQAIVGAIVGVGLVKGTAAVSRRKLGHIGLAWVTGPVITCVFSFALGWLFLALF